MCVRLMLVMVVLVLVFLPVRAQGQDVQRAVDGVVLNDEGLPQYSTSSLCAVDPSTGQSGAAVMAPNWMVSWEAIAAGVLGSPRRAR